MASFVPAPPRLELKEGSGLASAWRSWRQRWDAFEAVSKLSSGSDEYQIGMFITNIGDDETLRIVNTLP